MALVMGLYESISTAAPGIGITAGGAIAALASPRAALATAGIGGLAVTLTAWRLITPPHKHPHLADEPAPRLPVE
jgi:hypothetical protein